MIQDVSIRRPVVNPANPLTMLPRSPVRVVDSEAPTRWLAAGWRDFTRAPTLGLLYGGGLVAASYVLVYLLWWGGMLPLLPVLIGGFLLIAPLLAVGYYHTSRMLQAGVAEIDNRAIARLCQGCAPRLATVGLALAFVFMIWMLMALVLFAGFYGGNVPPSVGSFFEQILAAPQAPLFLLVGTAVGSALAAIAFAISAVSLPMILDREVGGIHGMATSIDATRANRKVMIAWAALIVMVTAVGMLPAFLGLAVAVPVLGHATWHAYRDLVPPEDVEAVGDANGMTAVPTAKSSI